MKILITFYNINNPGGILNNQEGLYAGLRELGHQVDVRLLLWKDRIKAVRTVGRHLKPETGAMGVKLDQEVGWYWPPHWRFAYKGKHNLKRWKEFASRYDLIIWQIPVPTMQKSNRGNVDWLELYDVPVKQLVYIHDGNMPDAYPWISLIADRLCGAVGVHPCAYHSLKNLALPRALAFSAQQSITNRIQIADSRELGDGWFSLQTFKGWKHVEDIVRAVPYMDDYPKRLAGGGIGWYYMTSKTKVKSQFLADRKYDPDMPKAHKGRKIWDIAIEHGLDYLGYITNAQRDAELPKAKFLIDPSWNKKYADIGDHFNRTIVDGIICGCVPIARNLGVATNDLGVGEFFKPWKNYIMIPHDATPKEFAGITNDAMCMKERQRLELLESGRELLRFFDYRFVAQTFVDIAQGRPAGVYARKNDRGAFNDSMVQAGFQALDDFFDKPLDEEEQEEELV